MQIVVVLILILAVLLVIFTLQNPIEITLNLFFWEISDAPLVMLLIGCVILGYILAAIYFYPKLWNVKKEYKQLIKFNKELKTLHELNHPKTEETHPEGIEFDDDDGDSF